MNVSTSVVKSVVAAMMNTGARKAVKYLSDKETVKASRQFRVDRRNTRETLVVTFGRPNYEEREFIKQCKRAREPFPVKKIQLKFYPEKKRS